MANKRMFSLDIVDSDAFIQLPLSSQALYFHLGMRADDEGVVNNPRTVMKIISATEKDINMLISKKFILPFKNEIIVIKHWKMNNYIQSDRFRKSNYQDVLSHLKIDKNKAYEIKDNDVLDTEWIQFVSSLDTECIQNVYRMDTKKPIIWKQKGYALYPDNLHDNLESTEISTLDTPCIQNVYSLDTECIQNVYSLDTEDNKEKEREQEREKEKEREKENEKEKEKERTKEKEKEKEKEREELEREKEKEKEKEKEIYCRVVEHLNFRAGTHYRKSTQKTRSLINARLREGFTLDDFKTVIDKKCVEWVGTDFEKFIRPETLFGTKFENYLNQKVKISNTKKSIRDDMAEIYRELKGEEENASVGNDKSDNANN